MKGSPDAWASYLGALEAELGLLCASGRVSGEVAPPAHIATTLAELRQRAASGEVLPDEALDAVPGIAETAYFLRGVEVWASGWRAAGVIRVSPSTDALEFHARLLQAGAREVLRRRAASAATPSPAVAVPATR